ncbi:unnamed protein product, partial [Prorocentrum cordatum]
RPPLLAVALADVPARHGEELDALARELGALEAQSAAVGPRLRQEQQEVARLRRDLARSDQEARAAGAAQEQHARGRERHEAWLRGEEEYAERLEAEAAVLLLQSPAALRQVRLEAELEQLQAECQRLEWDVQALTETQGAEERRVWSLADAAGRRGRGRPGALRASGRLRCDRRELRQARGGAGRGRGRGGGGARRGVGDREPRRGQSCERRARGADRAVGR